MKIRLTLIFIASILFTYCKEKTTLDNIESEPRQLYDFDKVEHYYLEFDDSDLENIYPEHKVCIDMVVYENYPIHLDTLPWCYDSLEFFGFTKKMISDDKFEEINQTFIKDKSKNDGIDKECSPIFRDFLFLYKNDKFQGFVSLCFSCDEVRLNSKNGSLRLGYTVDFNKLEKILY